MARSSGRRILAIFVGVFILLYGGTWLYEGVAGYRTYKGITNRERIDRIEFHSILDPSRHLIITNDTVLEKIKEAFAYFNEYTPQSPKMHSVFLQMEIYKKKKWTLELLKTKYSGWAIPIFTKWYRNDSLVAVLGRYSILDSLQFKIPKDARAETK